MQRRTLTPSLIRSVTINEYPALTEFARQPIEGNKKGWGFSPSPWQAIDHMNGMLKGCGGDVDITSEGMIDHQDHPNARGDQSGQ